MTLIRSIITTLFVYCLLQSLVFFELYRLWNFPPGFLLLFFTAQLIFYLALFLFLVSNKNLFYNTFTNQKETKVNGANKITLFRITMLPFLVLLTLVSQRCPAGPALTAAFSLTFISDFFDGRIARTWKIETYMGKILDSASDYLLLGITAGAFFFFKLLKPWLFWVIIGRLFFNSLVMLILFLVHRKLRPQTTPIGKTAIAAIMILLVIEAAKPLGLPEWISYVEIAAAFLIGISVIDKLIYLVRGLQLKAE
jgi:phosphatidylglycerophosphate synthase